MKKVLGIPQKSGIYCIENTETSQCYIGSSANMQKRCNAHRCLLNNGKHKNVKLQRSYIKYGFESFHFFVIEFTEVNDLIRLEQKIVSEKDPFFNLRIVVDGNRGIKLSSETKSKMSASHKRGGLSEAQLANLQNIQKNRIGKPVTGKVKESLKLGPLSLTGKPKSEKTKELIRLSKVGKKFNKETRKYECR